MQPMNTVETIRRIENLNEFSRKSGIPRRTLTRIKSGHAPFTSTAIAIALAIKAHKPKMKDKQ